MICKKLTITAWRELLAQCQYKIDSYYENGIWHQYIRYVKLRQYILGLISTMEVKNVMR